jgi:hypothetical protein
MNKINKKIGNNKTLNSNLSKNLLKSYDKDSLMKIKNDENPNPNSLNTKITKKNEKIFFSQSGKNFEVKNSFKISGNIVKKINL